MLTWKTLQIVVTQAKSTKINKKMKSIAHYISTTPWTKVGTDLFELKGKCYLVVVDYTANFFYVSLLPNKRSATVVTHTKRVFSKLGIHEKVVSDNESEYIRKDYKLLSKQWDFKLMDKSNEAFRR